ncbi:MAG: sugar nucleotidyltransferase [bacterium]
MKAIIPVAGIGIRLRPHTHTSPKALLDVAGKPILAHILDELVALGIDEVVLVVGHLRERIEAFARARYGRLRLHFVAQHEPLGNGHAVYVAREHLDGSPALIIFGDTIVKGDLAGMLRSQKSLAGVTEVDDPRRLGVVELGPDGNIRRIIEKPQDPPTNLAVIGGYFLRNPVLLRAALERQVAENLQARGEFWLADALQLMIDAGETMGVFRVEHWYDCGTLEALLQANRELLDFDPPRVSSNQRSRIIPPSYVDPTADVGNSVIGPHASIGERARVMNSTISDSIIGPAANVENSRHEHSLVGERAVVKGRSGRVNVAESGEGETV